MVGGLHLCRDFDTEGTVADELNPNEFVSMSQEIAELGIRGLPNVSLWMSNGACRERCCVLGSPYLFTYPRCYIHLCHRLAYTLPMHYASCYTM